MGRLRLLARLAARDLRRRRTEALLLLLAFTAAMTTLTLGLILGEVTDQPYQQTRAATHGPDVVALAYPPARNAGPAPKTLTQLVSTSGVTAHSGPFPAVWVPHLQADSHTASAQVMGRATRTAPVDQPHVTNGGWLTGDGTVVVERSFADALGIRVGATLSLDGRPFHVVGIAVTAAVPPFPQVCTIGCEPATTRAQGDRTGLLWATDTATRSLATTEHRLSYLLNLKLSDPDAAQQFMTAHNLAPDTTTGPFMNTWHTISWQDGKVIEMEQRDLAIGSWLLGLLAVASVAVLVGGRMADQIRRVGLLKAAGATPGLIAMTLLVEYVFLALVAAGLGLIGGRLAAPLFTGPGAGLLGTAQAPSITAGTVTKVVFTAVAVAAAATFVPTLRAARTSTVRALTDAARPPRRAAVLITLSARLPVTLLIGFRLAARRPRRTLLNIASVMVTIAGLVAVLTSRAQTSAQVQAAGLGNPQVDRLAKVLLALTVTMVVLAAVNAIFITWATVLDARHISALTRALGATPRQVSAGLSAAQVLPALLGATLGIPVGIGLFAAVRHGGTMAYPPIWTLAATAVVTAPIVAALTALPARLGARRPVAETLSAESA
ncbi:FtsX-like permease family protein [Streptomyces mirabilis]|uniref:FtsX-like permease family protein n=1 Tax=Streptomyces mirabilis TaxID=68239 RepID=UPI0036CB0370